MRDFDLCVIGGGAAGLVVAAGGAMLGARVALVEKNALGGDCLHHGCVPSKALLAAARAAQAMRDAGRFGLDPAEPAPELARVMRRVRGVIADLGTHDTPERFRGLGVEVIFGAGRFSSPRAFTVDGRTLTARRFVIATGSHPAAPALPGLERTPFLTSDTVFSLEEAVPHLVVLGGGAVGVELAQAFARLGSRVTLVESGTRILAGEDGELAGVIASRLAAEGVELLTGCEAKSVSGGPGRIRILTRLGGTERDVEGTHLLVATGRQANTAALGLDVAGVRVERGLIVTDRRLRTSARHIHACGDVTGPHPFTHMAEHQAGVVLRNALFRLPARTEERAVPWCIYTDPELARVGLSETEARAAGVRHQCYTYRFDAIDRARIDAGTDGLAKIVCDPRGRILGAALVGPHAGELIHEYILAVTHRMKAADVARAIHIYPALAQINRKVADERMKARLTPGSRRWLRRLFGLRGDR